MRTNAACVSSSCIYHSQQNMPLLQPLAALVVFRESCLHLGMSDLRCTRCSFSVSCRARYVSVQCRLVVLAAFASSSLRNYCYQVLPTSCFVLHIMTVRNAEQTQTETCVVGTTHFAKLCFSVGSAWVRWLRPAPTNQTSAYQPNQRLPTKPACNELLGRRRPSY